jgi:hypothetical protein
MGIASGLCLGLSGVQTTLGGKTSSCLESPDRLCDSPSFLFNGKSLSFPRVNWPALTVNQSLLPSAGVKSDFVCNSTNHVDRKKFTFFYIRLFGC